MSQPTSISFRALCAELVNELHDYKVANEQHDDALVNRARAALAQPAPEGPSDKELKAVYWEAFKNSAACGAKESWLAGLRAVARFARTAPAPSEPEQPVSEHRPVWTEGICGDGAAILKDGVMQPIEDVIAALNATSLAQPPASWWRSAGPTNYNEDFWRRDALEKLVHAAASFRLGVYSAEELEIFENRARAILARWGRPTIEPVPVAERLPGEGDCDSDGRCWWGDAGCDEFVPSWRLCEQPDNPRFTHWCPYWALPLPTPLENP